MDLKELLERRREIAGDLQGLSPQYLDKKGDHLYQDPFILRVQAAGDVSWGRGDLR